MTRRSGVQGAGKLKRKLRRIEPEITRGVRGAVGDVAEAIKQDAIALAPRDQGDLVRAIDAKVGRDGLAAVVGPGAVAADLARRRTGSVFGATNLRLSAKNQHLLLQFFKGYWIEFGTKKGDDGSHAQPARPFMQPAFDLNRDWGKEQIRHAVSNALKRVSRGG